VLERRYALFPQASGELVISPVEFEGEVVDPGQAGSGLSRLFARGERVHLRTPVVRARALPPPANYPGRTWLPAKNLQLTEEWSKDPESLRAGEPVTRTLHLQAVGLSAEQLPEISVTVTEGVKEYGDQPITRTTTDTDWVHGVREQRTALVPGNEGNYTLAEIRIDWWDTERNVLRQATIPARVLRVAAGTQDSAIPTSAGDGVKAEQLPPPPLWRRPLLWQGVSALLVFLWLATFIAWRRARARPQTAAAERDRGLDAPQVSATTLRRACLSDEPRAARRALLRWAAASWPEDAPRSLQELAKHLANAELRAELVRLDRALYASDQEPWRGKPLWQRARKGLVRPAPPRPPQRDDLPVLYPR
jgi:hypothetical protein